MFSGIHFSFPFLACGSFPFTMEAPLQAAPWRRLGQAIGRLFEVRRPEWYFVVWRIFSIGFIIVGFLMIATTSWFFAAVDWPRRETLFYQNLHDRRRGTSTEVDNVKGTTTATRERKISCP